MKSLQEKLDAALKECDQLRIENRYLKKLIRQAGIALPRSKTEPGKPTAGSNLTAINNESPADAKVALFRGTGDVVEFDELLLNVKHLV